MRVLIHVPKAHQPRCYRVTTEQMDVSTSQVEALQVREILSVLWRHHIISTNLSMRCAQLRRHPVQVLYKLVVPREVAAVVLQVVHQPQLRAQCFQAHTPL